LTRLLAYLPRGNTLSDRAWQRRHVFLQAVLLLHLPLLFLFGMYMGRGVRYTALVLSVPAVCLVLGRAIRHRRTASVLITAGLTYCSAALVSFSGGSIEAHFHFFIMIGFIALYQDWVPFLWNVGFTVLSHGLGSALKTNLIFSHPAGQTSPWVWSAIHGVAVLAACCGVIIFWETTEREQRKTLALTRKLAEAEITRRRFTSDLLVNLARRNQSLLYRQLGLINQLEDQAEDPDALADLFRLDHLATRIRRNAESLLVLSGEEPPRTWGRPVALVDVVRAAIAETEDLDRVVFAVDERLAVFGNAVADLTHLVAELVENAVHFSPPEASVILRTRPYLQTPGAHVLTVEDWGVGMRPDDMAAANELLATPVDVDLSVSQRLGLHVVARLAQRHAIEVSLTPTPGCGVTAAVVLPPSLFADPDVAPEQVFADGPDEVPAGVVPALAASTRATPVADLPAGPPPAGPAGSGGSGWAPAPAERWIDLTDGAVAGSDGPDDEGHAWSDGNGHHHGEPAGNGHPAADPVPAGDVSDWSGWWEPSLGELQDGERLSPIAARPPLSERAHPPMGRPDPSAPMGRPDQPAPMGRPDQPAPMGRPDQPGPMAGPPIREGSPIPEGVAPVVHSPRHGAQSHGPQNPGLQNPGLQNPGLQNPGLQNPGPQNPGPQDRGHQVRTPVGPASDTEPVAPDGPVLSRRVPQAHLAPELRRNGQAGAAPRAAESLPDADEARAALSRYQASRQAAKAMVDDGDAEPGRPAGGGWA
jgi:signal transduction histidine kinase